jgi:hypothetical protein
VSRPLSRVPFRWLEPTFPYLCALHFAMGTPVDNGGCYFNGETKHWLVFRQSLCRSSDGMGLGWVYEIANVLSAYLQKAVAEVSNKEREAGIVVTDFSKFSEAQLKKVVKLLGKSQGSFLLKQDLIEHRKNTLGRTTWTMPNADTTKRKISSKLMNISSSGSHTQTCACQIR